MQCREESNDQHWEEGCAGECERARGGKAAPGLLVVSSPHTLGLEYCRLTRFLPFTSGHDPVNTRQRRERELLATEHLQERSRGRSSSQVALQRVFCSTTTSLTREKFSEVSCSECLTHVRFELPPLLPTPVLKNLRLETVLI